MHKSIILHDSVAATYLKYFSNDPSKGRNSIVKVYNKKEKKEQFLPVSAFPLNKKAFGEEVEKFFSSVEKNYDSFKDLFSNIYHHDELNEKLKVGFSVIFTFILRKPIVYNKIIEYYNSLPNDVKREYGSDPWQSNEVIFGLFQNLITKRPYPIKIQLYPEASLITSDDPIVYERHPFGTVYLLPIDRRHLFCIGYSTEDHLTDQITDYINHHNFRLENINIKIKKQARVFYVI